MEDEGNTARHHETAETVPEELQKYFLQRYALFSLYDEGIHFTPSSWYGVTPEVIAEQIAVEIPASPDRKGSIVDAFGGIAGNSIAFARTGKWSKVHYFETDPETMRAAKINARVYGVEDEIIWHAGDFFDLLQEITDSVDAVFMSPPWGGVDYKHDLVFDLQSMEPYDIRTLGDAASSLSPEFGFVLYLPRSSDLRQIAGHVRDGCKVRAVNYCIEGASKALVIYYLRRPTQAKSLGKKIKFED